MACLLLAGFGPEVKVRNRDVLQLPWFQERLRLESPLTTPRNVLAVLAKIAPGRLYEGGLTEWTQEEAFLWHLNGRPLDSYSLKISGVYNICSPLPAKTDAWGKARTLIRSYHGDIAESLTVTKAGVLNGDALQGSDAIRHDIDVTQEAWDAFLHDLPMMHLPVEIVHLVAKGRWRMLLRTLGSDACSKTFGDVGLRFRHVLAFPSEDWCASRRPLIGQNAKLNLHMLPAHATHLASCIRTWSSQILQGLDEDQLCEKFTVPPI